MRVLLAIDGSRHSRAALEEVASREWPADTEVMVLTVIHSGWPLFPDPSFVMAAARIETIQNLERDAPDLLTAAAEEIRRRVPQVSVTTKILEGVPHETIVQEADKWGADLIVLGSHGYGPVRRAVLGSVATGVAAEASSAVEIIRMDRPPVVTGSPRELDRESRMAGVTQHRK